MNFHSLTAIIRPTSPAMPTWAVLVLTLIAALCCLPVQADDLEEFRIKREEVFEFTQQPEIERQGRGFRISFTSQGWCDVTVVIEDIEGKIVRHLASGILGDNAPEPLQQGSLRQTLLWDGKNDQGAYVDNLPNCRVRVSLGLKASFEKVLLWEPKLRMHQEAPLMQATAEGVYVYDGRVLDHVRRFDHLGQYAHTVYPFPADKIDEVQGVHRHKFPQDGATLPVKEGFHQATLLSSGKNAGRHERLGIGIDQHNNYHGSVWGNAATMLAVQDQQIALGQLRLNRLSTDGSTGGQTLSGPELTFPILPKGNIKRGELVPVSPRSAAFSPDGRWLYLTGYVHPHGTTASRDIVLISHHDWLPGVARLEYGADRPIETFLGSMELAGSDRPPTRSDSELFGTPTSLDVDAAGRIYVSDWVNDQIQVFSPSGELLKTIATKKPAQVVVDGKSQEIYVFSWWVPNAFVKEPKAADLRRGLDPSPPTLTIYRSFDDPAPVATCPVPFDYRSQRSNGVCYRAEVDPWSEPTRVWLASEWGRVDILTRANLKRTNIRVYDLKRSTSEPSAELELYRDFNEDAPQNGPDGLSRDTHDQRPGM